MSSSAWGWGKLSTPQLEGRAFGKWLRIFPVVTLGHSSTVEKQLLWVVNVAGAKG